jgi:FixJ family two-component response regulator
MQDRATVFVVDRDPVVRERIGEWIDSAGLFVRTFPSGPHFLAGFDRDDPGCLVLRMRGSGGLELQDRLMRRGAVLPIIVLTGSAERPTESGEAGQLLDCVRRAIELDRGVRELRRKHAGLGDFIERLTPRERDVMKLVVAGNSNGAPKEGTIIYCRGGDG